MNRGRRQVNDSIGVIRYRRGEPYRDISAHASSRRPVGGTVALPTSWRRLSQPRCAREGCRNSLCMASFASLPPKGLPPRPPDKGSFPLDHFRECSDAKAEYMECLKLNGMKVRPSLPVRPALVLAPRPATCHSDIRPFPSPTGRSLQEALRVLLEVSHGTVRSPDPPSSDGGTRSMALLSRPPDPNPLVTFAAANSWLRRS